MHCAGIKVCSLAEEKVHASLPLLSCTGRCCLVQFLTELLDLHVSPCLPPLLVSNDLGVLY